ncbi:glycosyltransferase [Cyanobium sp. ATX-6F1]|uniref:glycosyltransferase n=1 Tax=Cyanobium sp. ATX-6F1 TaxID=3137388 RepID=UPI0039BDFBC1
MASTRNWVSPKADGFWAITEEVAEEVRHRGYPPERIAVLGPLLHPPFHDDQRLTSLESSSDPPVLPLLVLGSGSNGANNHEAQLNALLPFSGRLRVVALCGKRAGVVEQLHDWARAHPGLPVQALGFQGPAEMVELYREAWAMVARPGARTATEALALGCPLIFNCHGVTMPQELLALRYFQARDLQLSIRKPGDLANHVGRLLDDPAAYHAWRQRYSKARLSSDPLAVVRYLLPDALMQV